MRKLAHLQILRTVAASLVVVDHSFTSLDFRGVPCSQYIKPGFLLGHLGVTAFFVVSGLIMVRQSSSRFGEALSPIHFAYRRILRIVPMYWMATMFWFAHYLQWGKALARPKAQLLLSLCFIPNFIQNYGRMEPVLEPGWTLNYEMSFYLLFSFALFFPRRVGILILFVVPQLLAAWGHSHVLARSSVPGFYTDIIILCMAYGVLIGFLETELKGLPQMNWRISPAFLLLIPTFLILAKPLTLGRSESWEVLSLFSTLVVLACTLTAGNEQFGWFGRTLVLLGDASFSTYLFHLFIYPTLFVVLAKIATLFHTTLRSPLLFAFAAVVVANGIGLVIHLGIERPLTRTLQKFRFRSLKRIPSENGQ